MNISALSEALQADVQAASEGADPKAAEVARRLGRLLEASVRVRLLDALSESAAELSDQVPAGRVEVRVAGDEVSLVFVPDVEESGEVPVDEDSARITLRLPESLKVGAESAASRQGLSMNGWLVRAVKRALDERPARGHRVRGFAQS